MEVLLRFKDSMQVEADGMMESDQAAWHGWTIQSYSRSNNVV